MDFEISEVPELAAEEIVSIESDSSEDSSHIGLVPEVDQQIDQISAASELSNDRTPSAGYSDTDSYSAGSNDGIASISENITNSEYTMSDTNYSEVESNDEDSGDDQLVVISESSSSSPARLPPASMSNVLGNSNALQELITVDANVAAENAIAGTSVDLNTSVDCFRVSSKKFDVASEAPLKAESYEYGEDGESCPICFESWTNSGLHRLASLRCGHLFGQSCIEKWLKGQNGKCPQCNAKAHRKDIRVLFAKSLKVHMVVEVIHTKFGEKTVDTTERDRALSELEQEKELRRNAELEAAKARMHHQMALNECHQLRQELERQRQQVELLRKSLSGTSDPVATGSQQLGSNAAGQFLFERQIKISEAGGCRVLGYCFHMATLCISQQSPNALFPGFGVKKLSSLDFKTSEYVSIHSKTIRDLSFNPRTSDATLLSCSIDKSIRLTSLHSNKIMQSYECVCPVWSCAWNLDDKNVLYAGLQNGTVCVFDVRNLSEPAQLLNQNSMSRSPVVSLQYSPQVTGSQPRPGGVIVGQLDRSTFFEKRTGSDYKIHLLPLEANLTSLSLEESTSHMLASYRPNARCPNVRHQMCEFVLEQAYDADSASVESNCTCRSVHMFYSGSTQKLLARSRIIKCPNGEILACAGDEASQSLCIWNASTGQLQQKTPTSDPVIDICPVNINDQSYLAALTERCVNIYRWQH